MVFPCTRVRISFDPTIWQETETVISRNGEFWPSVIFAWSSLRSALTASTWSQYSQVRGAVQCVLANTFYTLHSNNLNTPKKLPFLIACCLALEQKDSLTQRILHGRAVIRILSSSKRYFQYEKIKSVSPSGHVIFCLFYRY